MNLGDLRSEVFRQCDWAPSTSTEAVAVVNSFINRAYKDMALDTPYLLFEEEMRVVTQAPYIPTLATDLVSVEGGDPWVLSTNLLNTNPLWTDYPPATAEVAGMTIEVTDPDGVIHKRKIRTIDVVSNQYHIVLWEPWRNTTDEDMEYKIYREEVPLPDDVVLLRSAKVFNENSTSPLEIIPPDKAEDLYYRDVFGNIPDGVPERLWRGPAFQLPAPTKTPTLVTVEDTWSGEPQGTFSYCITYTWGVRDLEDLRAVGPSEAAEALRRTEPLWESGPSPLTSEGTSVYNTTCLKITLPDLAWQLGFGDNLMARYRKTGWKKRIYRRRHLVAGSSGDPSGNTNIEAQDAYYLIHEVDDYVASWTDDGTKIPDMNRRLRKVAGYSSIFLYPRPDERYLIELRGIRSPQPLEDDQDVVRIRPEAHSVLIDKTLQLLYEKLKDFAAADRAIKRANERIVKLGNLQASLTPSTQWMPRTFASVAGRTKRRLRRFPTE